MKKSKLPILSAQDPRWREFVKLMEGEEGCNFRRKVDGSWEWDCASDESRPIARKILEKMGGIDVEKTLKYFERKGGYCDCEILFNVR